MKNWQLSLVSTVLIAGVFLGGCSSGPHEHYVSPKVQGEAQRINLDEVQKAFWDTKGKTFDEWMGSFEKRVNEIYDGKEVVMIDATRDSGKLVVTGYIDKDNKEGFQSGDEKLFSIEQTGDAVNNEMPYRVAGYDNNTYYQGSHSSIGNSILSAMLISHMMGGWGGRYYTPAPQVVILRDHQMNYRNTPSYQTQQTANKSFFSRFKTSSTGDLQSKNKFGFGNSSSTSGEKKGLGSIFGRSSSSTGSESSSGSSWGGRRSSSGFGSRSFGRGWGGRRR